MSCRAGEQACSGAAPFVINSLTSQSWVWGLKYVEQISAESPEGLDLQTRWDKQEGGLGQRGRRGGGGGSDPRTTSGPQAFVPNVSRSIEGLWAEEPQGLIYIWKGLFWLLVEIKLGGETKGWLGPRRQ